ncbi:alpha-L-fucosidase [uncultured Sunxiuqinia sp.]|uniref:alpha-L-fucosidase n=1 Tax=uncultured Sunxiuqinia sp. TaxID=1573825 RepID=UPI002627E4BF|nr:alpha-L-fucosidase [uncultured Sunxiuqinia sp.]
MKKRQSCFLIALAILLASCHSEVKEKPEVYSEDWTSLAKHNEEPAWFQDAKFGIYFHWGVYSVPAFGDEWYPRHMHFKNRKEYQHHLETYGPLSDFGYHDFVPLFKAEQFNAHEWAALFKQAGARFAGPVAEHHDGFSMWDSDLTPWNVGDKGPQKDIMKELKTALTAQELKFITTFHHARNLQRYADVPHEENYGNSHYPRFEGTAPAEDDHELNYLYGNIPEEQWLEEIWFGKLKEVIDNYQPDIIWFDSWLDQIPEQYRQKFCAYYLNEAQKLDKEVVIVRKQDDLPLEVSVDDLEKSRKNKLGEKVWMTDETISKGSWCYTENLQIKPAVDMIHVLIDIVSKNGVLLLNISPKSDGTIPADQQEVLRTMGAWLDKYGEAIYETRPWHTYGEGPTIEPKGDFKNHREFLKIKYSADDLRYTTKGNTVYAMVLGVPDSEQPLLMKAFASQGADVNIKKVTVLGSKETVQWQLKEDGLFIEQGYPVMDTMAQVFKIEI